MNRFRLCLLRIFVPIMILSMLLSSLSVSASTSADTELPYESYTYWYGYSAQKKAVYSRPMYDCYKVLDFIDFGLESRFLEITDICTFSGETYILDGGASKVVILDEQYRFKNTFSAIIDADNNEYNYQNASGIFVNESGIYIADTDNARVLCCDKNGIFKKILTLPESRNIPDEFEYKPLSLSIDSKGYTYVLSEGSFYGAVLYSPTGDFLGFYGANKVKNGIVDAAKNFISKLFSNDVKKSKSVRALPFQFNDLYIDNNDFVYTATGDTNVKNSSTSQLGQIKRFSPGGTNILDSDEVEFADSGVGIESQNILGLEVDEQGYIYAVDALYGHIFMYDSECNIMSVFGTGYGSGIQDGAFSSLDSIALNGQDIIVSDKVKNTISIFKITDYGRLVKKAQTLTIKGKYTETEKLWNEIITLDSNSQIAYKGLAKVYYNRGEYKKALEYAKIGCDRETYSSAFEKMRDKVLKKNFPFIILGVLLLLTAIFVLYKKLKTKCNGKIIKSVCVKNFLTVVPHPAESFNQIKEKKVGSVLIGIIVLVLFYITSVMRVTNGGFAYTIFDPTEFNSLFILLQTVGLVLLFVLSFWCVSALFSGLGRIKDIFIVVSYSIVPLVIGNMLEIVLSNILVPSELSFLNIVITALTIYTIFLLAMGLIIINDFEFGKFIGVTVLAIIGMVIILFLMIVVFMLLQLLKEFAVTVFNETVKLLR